MEIEPRGQKTWPDFVVTEQMWGVRAIDMAEVEREGRRLYYSRDGKATEIKRIYNRVIPDELERKRIQLPFGYGDDLDVEWAGHPAWYFRISKFSIPFLRHPSVPETRFLDGSIAGPAIVNATCSSRSPGERRRCFHRQYLAGHHVSFSSSVPEK